MPSIPNTATTLYESLGTHLMLTHHFLVEQLKHHLEPFDLTVQQYHLLRILKATDGPLSSIHIRERMLEKMSDTSRLIDRLLLKGLVRKSISRHDRRLVDVVLTRKGQLLLERLEKNGHALTGLSGQLTHREIGTLVQLLEKVRKPRRREVKPKTEALVGAM